RLGSQRDARGRPRWNARDSPRRRIRFRTSALNRGAQPRDLGVTSAAPVGRPDAVDLPPQPLEHFLPDAITVPCRVCGVIHCAIALDAEQEASTLRWVDDAEVNPVLATADLMHHVVAQRSNRACNALFER